jgi:tRNA(fMet)-specific endonuclease VapC
MWLLDTNACVEFLRNRHALVVQRIQAKPVAELRLCSIVVAELYYGVLRSSKPAENRAKVDAFVQPLISLPFDNLTAEIFARIRFDLEKAGTPIGPYDLQIAAVALAHGLTLVTHNTAEFSRVPGLVCEDWQQP